ncbi:unnamed protein product [Caenorhabditis auriculariae]|uniref:Major facilitator superfamily (MFS) profile domain-containing protein n=1 Tax=Caenorhabditis auriculariae TaxID=2777116 RepID=A0A8S1H6D3_9PELO|nr:unnamed protein product [Caenorhabditis auriculariae]
MDVVMVERQDSKVIFWHKTRVIIMILSMFCMATVSANSISVNFTIICMDDVIAEQKGNSTEPHWLENNQDVSLLFSANAIGQLLGVLPSVHLLTHLGVRKTLTAYGAASALGTIFFPAAVDFGLPAVLITRVLHGIGISTLFSAMGAISAGWSPNSEISTYLAVLSSSFQMSFIVTNPVAGLMCESSLGWRTLYYILSGMTVFFFVLFYFFYADSPSLHRNVSGKELNKINSGKAPQSKKGVPYKAMVRDKVVLGIWTTVIGGNLGFFMLMFYGPIYLNKVLKLNVTETGFANALPYVFAALVKMIAGPLSDYSTCISERLRMIMFASVSQGALALGLVVMSLTTNRYIAQTAFTFAIVLAGCNIVGVIKCAQMVARQYVHFVMAVISFLACISTFVLPFIVGYTCPNNTAEEWSRFFLVIAGIIVLTNLTFPFVATTEPAAYTLPGWTPKGKVQDTQ